MHPNYGYDDADDEYSFPPSNNRYGDYGDYDDEEYNCYFNNEDEYLDMSDACSSTDCTGLVTNGPGVDEELEDFRDIYTFGQPQNRPM